MYDKDLTTIQGRVQAFSAALKQFKRDWFNYALFEIDQVPYMGYDIKTEELIIRVPHVQVKGVQYIPFVYKNYKTEIVS